MNNYVSSETTELVRDATLNELKYNEKFADRACEISAKPPLGQVSPIGNGAHSVPFEPSSFAGCAPEITSSPLQTAQKPALSEDPGGRLPPRAKIAHVVSPGGSRGAGSGAGPSLASIAPAPAPPEFNGTTILSLDQIVTRVLAANRAIERLWEPCPQGQDCAGDGQHRRIFDCEEGCGFRGCSACMEEHEAEPHTGDSATVREMYGSS